MAPKRRKGLKGKRMHRLRVLISEAHFEKLRAIAPDYGRGAVIEDMIDVVSRKLQARATEKPSSARQVPIK